MTTLDELFNLVPANHKILLRSTNAGEEAPCHLGWFAHIVPDNNPSTPIVIGNEGVIKQAKYVKQTFKGSGTTAIEAMQNALYTYSVSTEREQ